MQRPSSGVIGLLAVIMIGAMMLAGGITIAFIGQSQVILAGDVDGEHVTRMLATSCVEEAAHRLKLNASYVGGVIPLGSIANSCTAVVTGSGTTRTLTATTTYGDYTKTIVATLTKKSNVAASASGWSVTAWSEGDPP
jgi:hypothetical protein